MKTAVLFATVLLNALSTGFFFAWSVSVILGTKNVGDFTYLEVMQNINREILNTVFYSVFFGSLIALMGSAVLQYNNRPAFWWVLASTAFYLLGTIGVTAFGNVPLNEALDALDIVEMSSPDLERFRSYYEDAWNRRHSLRTVGSVISFVLLLTSIFIQKTI